MLDRLLGRKPNLGTRSFSLCIPGDWQPVLASAADVHVLRSDREQITVSEVPLQCRAAEREAVFRHLLDRRREAEVADGAHVEVTDVAVVADGSILIGQYFGRESAADRLFTCVMRAAHESVLVLYYESVGLGTSHWGNFSESLISAVQRAQVRRV
jgi:hypothetical protein